MISLLRGAALHPSHVGAGFVLSVFSTFVNHTRGPLYNKGKCNQRATLYAIMIAQISPSRKLVL